jgi:hypothetical protein
MTLVSIFVDKIFRNFCVSLAQKWKFRNFEKSQLTVGPSRILAAKTFHKKLAESIRKFGLKVKKAMGPLILLTTPTQSYVIVRCVCLSVRLFSLFFTLIINQAESMMDCQSSGHIYINYRSLTKNSHNSAHKKQTISKPIRYIFQKKSKSPVLIFRLSICTIFILFLTLTTCIYVRSSCIMHFNYKFSVHSN